MNRNKLLQACIEAMRPVAELAHDLPPEQATSDTLLLGNTVRLTVGDVRLQALMVAHYDHLEACLAETQPMDAVE